MTPQSNFMVLAPVAAGRVGELRQLLASMNTAPGVVDPRNSVVPFSKFPTLHLHGCWCWKTQPWATSRPMVCRELTIPFIWRYWPT